MGGSAGIGVMAALDRRRRQAMELRFHRIPGLLVIGIGDDAIDRAHLHALRLVEVPDALRALERVDNVAVLTRRDRLVRALRFAQVAVDAIRIDQQCHLFLRNACLTL